MDFVKKILHQISRKSEAVSQITFDEDYNVPDARPDVGRMIQKKGEVTIGDVQISEGKARVFGGLTFHLLYVSDGERRRICQLSGELPIDETIHLDGLTGGRQGLHHLGSGRSEPASHQLAEAGRARDRHAARVDRGTVRPCRADGNPRGERRRGKKAGIPRG